MPVTLPKPTTSTPTDSKKYFDYGEAQEYLRLSRRSLSGAVHAGKLRAIRFGTRVVFDREDLDSFAQSCKS